MSRFVIRSFAPFTHTVKNSAGADVPVNVLTVPDGAVVYTKWPVVSAATPAEAGATPIREEK